ncbi:class 1 fructose-bisphosphatase [Tropicibacter naphthalenivorans]|uniref:Fructose-1,6-bisphosphatase class 1 n=1 Tax=Tropicibacter naphthalenivorans TaxID=441103 RepID=A0A0P1GJV9_9RHOB|nr:class 1 fructose-bisphosphatase [Tropicibacter naphthalenivorans]CUH82426.1 Fructose-1,6-bisphosphatase class 1 [Tropicibacter naphthalenivorans]SMD06250.1 D-fructose 1,6-bisphosphatase [Tropicibacter naphthalenivorans]
MLPMKANTPIPDDLAPVMNALCRVAADLSDLIARGPLGGRLGASVGNNTDGDDQKALDVMADDVFAAALKGTGIRWYASEEQETVNEIDADGTLALAIDPLDGSSNIDVNVSIGTIFGIQPALDSGEATFLRSGRHLRASGYFIYGPQTALVVTFGDGVRQFIFDRATATFTETETVPTVPASASEFAINASNYRHWSAPVRAYIDDCLAGVDGPRAKNFNMRWVASLVAETHRIMCRGGIFLYPGDARKGYEQGRLRLVYECAPIGFLVEQAGGRATTGTAPVLDRVPDSLHARTPFVFGTIEKVDRVTSYHDLPEREASALFANRGLFRA